jgi:hypothetical protein
MKAGELKIICPNPYVWPSPFSYTGHAEKPSAIFEKNMLNRKHRYAVERRRAHHLVHGVIQGGYCQCQNGVGRIQSCTQSDRGTAASVDDRGSGPKNGRASTTNKRLRNNDLPSQCRPAPGKAVVDASRVRQTMPYVAPHTMRRTSAIDGRTT